MSKRLFLIDAMAQIYRAHFAMSKNPLFTQKGENVSAVFGLTNILIGLINREKPDLIAAVYDTAEPTFRHHIFEDYKATREKMPDELVAQLPRIDQLLEAMGIHKVILPGYEADDLVGTLALQAEKEGYETYLVTGDKDYYQLVSDSVKFYNIKRGLDDPDIFGPAEVEEVFGVPPEKVIDVLGLAGDTSDNVPGVPKVGMKTAIKYVKEYGSLEETLNNWESVGGKSGENLRDFREQAILSKDLVTIRREAPIDEKFEDFTLDDWRTPKLKKFFTEMEFRSFFRYLDEEPKTIDKQGKGVKYSAVVNEKQLNKLIKEMSDVSQFAFDTETTSKDPMQARLVGMSFSAYAGKAYYLPVNFFAFDDMEEVDPAVGRPLLQCEEVTKRLLDELSPILEEGPAKIAQNAKYDFLVMKRHGVDMSPLGFDPMIADYLMNPTSRGHGIDNMALNYLSIKKIETSELIGAGKAQITMDKVPLKLITKYASEDADVALRLAIELEPKLEEKELEILYKDVELPVCNVLMNMEYNGIKLDAEFLRSMSMKMKEEMADLQDEVWDLAGMDFNLSSPKQLGHVLFEKLQLPTNLSKKTKSGWSTDQSVLEKLAPIHDLPRKLLDFRSLKKLTSTYIDALPQLVNPYTGRVHTTYNQTVAATGRLSSNDPNLQNIPIRSQAGAEIRKAFIADKGNLLMSIDYSQVELRMMAHLSNDVGMIEAFKRGDDIHQATAAKIYGVPLEEVTKEQRSSSKQVNFGVLFGMREFGLSSRMGISIPEAKEFIEGYFGAFPDVSRYIEQLLKQAQEDGYVATILGRKRPLLELTSSNRNVRQGAERMAIATAVQGSAADLIKVAMVRMHDDIVRKKLPYKMLLQVHDELIFEIPEDKIEEAAAWARRRMESAMELSVPLIAEPGWGNNWLEAH